MRCSRPNEWSWLATTCASTPVCSAAPVGTYGCDRAGGVRTRGGRRVPARLASLEDYRQGYRRAAQPGRRTGAHLQPRAGHGVLAAWRARLGDSSDRSRQQPWTSIPRTWPRWCSATRTVCWLQFMSITCAAEARRTLEVVGEAGILRWEYEANRILRYAPATGAWTNEQGDPRFEAQQHVHGPSCVSSPLSRRASPCSA